ncbi:hypothetical protein H5410_017707 [Solanum commersonii]|uniref:Uncharacterized protein n=1 Tax=Solanum commersonii TaxID=4109 RepID=A0A9J6A0R7_SOLCO|nr:hypothetical protein H5410_017707 [Solanum commersonii]
MAFFSNNKSSMSRSSFNSNFGSNPPSGTGSRYSQKSHTNSYLYCDYCNWKGHVRSTCYKLHGYPTDWKGKRKTTTGLIPEVNLIRVVLLRLKNIASSPASNNSTSRLTKYALDQENEKTKAKANYDNMLASGGAIAPVDSVEGLSVGAQPAQVVSLVVAKVLAKPHNSLGIVPAIVDQGLTWLLSRSLEQEHIQFDQQLQ